MSQNPNEMNNAQPSLWQQVAKKSNKLLNKISIEMEKYQDMHDILTDMNKLLSQIANNNQKEINNLKNRVHELEETLNKKNEPKTDEKASKKESVEVKQPKPKQKKSNKPKVEPV